MAAVGAQGLASRQETLRPATEVDRAATVRCPRQSFVCSQERGGQGDCESDIEPVAVAHVVAQPPRARARARVISWR